MKFDIRLHNLNLLPMSKVKVNTVVAPVAAPVAVVTTKNAITTKRFVIRKSLIGTNTVISFTNAKNELCTYDHDKVYNALKAKFDLMPCFEKYGSYTNTNNLPAFVRALPELV
jgi:hypothetical protein